jgi:L-histidine Nalpha-methyltransferase / hercynylcysteine S-oxide synthase
MKQQYARYLEQTHSSKLPASWAELRSKGAFSNGYSNGHMTSYTNGHTNGYSNGYSNGLSNGSHSLPKAFLEDKAVRTVYGLVPLKHALDWPVFASYDELAGCANWMGGRIPTLEEARSIYSHVDGLKAKEAERHLGKIVPAVNAYAIPHI